ncbi:MAG TPA: tRNA (adenosine(37)-N6)-threonylcarbamoyltransferase complex dimerization subunit type 1 TsaB, partial [Acidimicrobiia bacterium]|nr:tRNA (adenosine(37)-N6)-threonylcarbamoyltransferase complex dimerization subunit type 1 TsaB [Acidimicrobiia bacterium]
DVSGVRLVKLLAIETSTAQSGVVLSEGRTVIAEASRLDRRGHATFLIPAIDFCFEQAGWFPHDIDAIVVDLGPGLYTGIRVGVATAQGLATALGIPVVGGSSLDTLALAAATGHRHIYSLVDVRRGELAVATYQPVPGGVVRDGPPALMTSEVLRAFLMSDPGNPLLVGDSAALPEDALSGIHRVKIGKPRYPTARTLLEVGLSQLEKDSFPSETLRPIYLREPDVTLNWDKLQPEGPWSAPS